MFSLPLPCPTFSFEVNLNIIFFCQYLTGLIASPEGGIFFPNFYKDVRSIGANLKFLGYGAHCAAYSVCMDRKGEENTSRSIQLALMS